MPAGSTAPVGETIGLIVENEDEIASVQEQNKGNQPEVSTSDQLELVSNKTEEKLMMFWAGAFTLKIT